MGFTRMGQLGLLGGIMGLFHAVGLSTGCILKRNHESAVGLSTGCILKHNHESTATNLSETTEPHGRQYHAVYWFVKITLF
jgi:hypothetical protein